jgi:tetratricopeptide (TPR) repeat protein
MDDINGPANINNTSCTENTQKISDSLNDYTSTLQLSLFPPATQFQNTTRRQRSFKPRHSVQNFLLLWLDSSFDESNNDCVISVAELRRFVNIIKIFRDVNQCVDFLTELQYEKAFMIVSDSLGQFLVPLIHDVPQLNSVYVFCRNESNCEQWEKNWSKVKGFFTQVTHICELLQKAIRECDRNSISISIVSTNDALTKNLDQLDQSFMYTGICKEILLDIKYDEQSINNLATYCRSHYTDNDPELNKINKFEQEYHLNSPIWWYTSEWFLYSMLNRALRTQEVDTIINFGIFMRDLHQHIKKLYSEQFASHTAQVFTVYRGQGMLNMDFEKLLKTKDGLISFNNFLSTSIDPNVSFAFAESNQTDSNMTGVLFVITIDTSISSIPFAAIGNISNYQTEKEILFSMHTIFRIGDIEQIGDNERLWRVKLTLTNDNDKELNALTERIRNELLGSTGWHRMAYLLIQLGEPDKAERIYRVLLDQTSDNDRKGDLYNQLGMIKDSQGDYVEAISSYEKALEIHERKSPKNHFNFAASYNNIAFTYYNMREYSKAISYYEKARRIWQDTLPQNHPNQATSLNNISLLYYALGEFSKAISFSETALKIYQETLPPNHPLLATSYNNIAMVYHKMKDYLKALSFYEQALAVSEKILPPNHPNLGTSYMNIASLYNDMSNYPKACSFFEKALEIEQKVLPQNHPHLANTYGQIGSMYNNMKKYSEALLFYRKGLEIRKKVLPPNHSDLAISYTNIGSVYEKIRDYPKALEYYEKRLEIKRTIHPPNHSDLVISYNKIGFIYEQMGQYSKALEYYEKVLEINQKIYPPNHFNFTESYNNIGMIYCDIGEYSKALSFYKKTLQILEQSFPTDHPHFINVYNNIGTVYHKTEHNSQAIAYFEKALEILQKINPPNDIQLATAYNNIGAVYMNMREYSKVLVLYEKALEILRKVLPSDHNLIFVSYNNIGSIHETMEEYSKALYWYKRAFEIAQRTLSPDHPHLENIRKKVERLEYC